MELRTFVVAVVSFVLNKLRDKQLLDWPYNTIVIKGHISYLYDQVQLTLLACAQVLYAEA